MKNTINKIFFDTLEQHPNMPKLECFILAIQPRKFSWKTILRRFHQLLGPGDFQGVDQQQLLDFLKVFSQPYQRRGHLGW